MIEYAPSAVLHVLPIVLSQKGRHEPVAAPGQLASVVQGPPLLVPATQALVPHSESMVHGGDMLIVTSAVNSLPAWAIDGQLRVTSAASPREGTKAVATTVSATIAHRTARDRARRCRQVGIIARMCFDESSRPATENDVLRDTPSRSFARQKRHPFDRESCISAIVLASWSGE